MKENSEKKFQKKDLMIDAFFIILSIVFAVILLKNGFFEKFLSSLNNFKIIGIFVSGMFFTSVFTSPVAMAAFIQFSKEGIFIAAFFGALGALLGDFIIFKFVKNRVLDDLIYLTNINISNGNVKGRFESIFKLKLFRWITIFLGAVIIASPFPDELGLIMLGISNLNSFLFLPFSFVMNFIGILIIGGIANFVL